MAVGSAACRPKAAFGRHSFAKCPQLFSTFASFIMDNRMRNPLRNDILVTVLTGLAYMLIWAPAVYLIDDLDSSRFWESMTYRSWMNLFSLLVTVCIFHVLNPLFRNRRPRYLWIILSIIIVLLALSVGYIAWLRLGMAWTVYPRTEESMINGSYIIRGVIFQLYGITFISSVKLLIRNTTLRNKYQQLQLEKKISELNYLKSQTNPHFLFNTLSNIYALAKKKSERTADSVLRLSDILRYMLYETQQERVGIKKEIEIIEEYIELERMRYDNTLRVRFEKDIDDPDTEIPPLLLIPLIENAFKHGVSETIREPYIDIYLSVRNNTLELRVENSTGPQDSTAVLKENIGLANLRKQLSLQFRRWRLDIDRNPHSFWIYLNIDLKSYANN